MHSNDYEKFMMISFLSPKTIKYIGCGTPFKLHRPSHRKNISILTLYRMRMQGNCDVYKWTILKRTSPEVKCLHLTSSRCEMCTPSVSNVIYHKFSHGAAFYTLNGKNVNVMLESVITRFRHWQARVCG